MSRVITDEQAQFFHDNGYLILRGVLDERELSALRRATDELIGQGTSGANDDPDFAYGKGLATGAPVLKRVEYVIDKKDACKALLGHPFILRSVEKLMGPDLIPTWDSMVIKMPGEGIVVPWHRDAGTECVGDVPIFNVDFYLDEADRNTCVWVIPGSHLWEPDRIKDWIAARPAGDVPVDEFVPDGAVPAMMQPGDVMFHNILVLHGSPSNRGDKLRRVIYYEFRAAHVEKALGPHIPEYIPLKQNVLNACIQRRAKLLPDEEPYLAPAPHDQPSTYRYAHGDYWRK
jgi:phytanoyl-CoA hydroxylase